MKPFALSALWFAALAGCSPEVMDAATEANALNCTDNVTASFRFLGPETIELTRNGESHILQRERSASGARYVGARAEFWNKGKESMLRIGESRYRCVSPEAED